MEETLRRRMIAVSWICGALRKSHSSVLLSKGTGVTSRKATTYWSNVTSNLMGLTAMQKPL